MTKPSEHPVFAALSPTARAVIDNTAWLAGYAAYQRGEGCPWGDESSRAGWVAAKADGARPTCVVCGERVHKGLDMFGEPCFKDSDGMPSSESPRFHDHDIDA